MPTTQPTHGPVLPLESIEPGKWYRREDALPPEGLCVLCVHNRGSWIHSPDQAGVEMVVLYRQCDNPDPDVYVCPNNQGAGYMWKEFGPDSFWGHSIDRWMRPQGINS